GVVGGTHRDGVCAWFGCGPTDAPESPGVVGIAGAEVGGLPLALPTGTVDANLDRADPAVLRPGHTAERHRPARYPLAVAWHVDSRLRLDRPTRRPAQPGPVRLGPIETRQLQVHHPFGRRHVSVQTRHHQPRRITVLGG